VPLNTQYPEEKIAQSIIPYNRDDDRARYLGLRASGFAIREALSLVGKSQSTLSFWRHDPVFADLESKLPELRKTLGIEYAGLEFLRNYRLILEKDYRVIRKSMKEEELSTQEQQYLLRLRAHYTPQQLQIIEALIAGDATSDGFNFADFVIRMARTQERVEIETRKRSPSQLAPIAEAKQ